MNGTILRTDRLELIGSTPETLRAESDDRARFGELLEARIPPDWPPELYDDGARRYTLERLESAPEQNGWWSYYVVRPGDGGRELIGIVGYKGPPSEDGTVEVGYGVLDAHRRKGYASEATAALVERAFALPSVRRVIAETLPELAPSIGVLEKGGFTLAEGKGSEEGVIRFELPRERWEARRSR
jgi:[ribosomal protein S5]-alanine N-acetyltransferase